MPHSDHDSIPRFHLAVAVDDLTAARGFYGDTLGLHEGRSSQHWIDWNMYGHQVVTHLSPRNTEPAESSVDGHNVPIPHFGVILSISDFHALTGRLRAHGVQFVREPHVRFPGEAGEQWTMFLRDPADNALEFKAFADDTQVFT
ncbi:MULTISPECIES: VOC family protein [unclassified Mycolicibacterium]|uniref:VOC family protein n=1 Tax=unclassified Mycolicibacterium TaxID=2636767 RepID=UPI001F4C33B1|nr:VOC family protein [Mycolicibacterium sp. YH-1]UNB51421.1 VOC family protein [Mycolicibacterium sp. YH-1]